jgi:hypothetical protein
LANEDWVLVEGGAEHKSDATKRAPDTNLLLRLLGDRMLDKGDIFVEVSLGPKVLPSFKPIFSSPLGH